MGSTWRQYYYSGLRIASEWEIEQWAAFEQPISGSIDLTIRNCDSNFRTATEDYLHDLPEIGRFVLRGGTEIIVIPKAEVDQRLVNMFLTASAWGVLCYQRGIHLLHCSAIRLRAQAFAFSGNSGSGKSTLAAWLGVRGYETICDDTCRLETVDDRICLYPSARWFKLWPESLWVLGREQNSLEPETPDFDKFQIPMPGSAIVEPQPLGAVYLLGWGDLSLQRLIGAEAVRAFLESATYRPEYLDPLGKKQAFIQNAIQLVDRVPVYKLQRPRDLSAMDDTTEVLERHWNDEYPQA